MITRNHLIHDHLATIALLILAGCGGSGDRPVVATEHTVTATELAALPTLTVDTGVRVCLATGYDDCPLHRAVANPLGGGRIALWEPNRTIMVWSPTDSSGSGVGRSGTKPGEYRSALAIRAKGSGYQIVAIDSGRQTLLDLDRNGDITRRSPLPMITGQAITGFVGDQPIRQRFHGWASADGGELQLIRLKQPTDSVGETILEAPVAWMRGGTVEQPPFPPLVATTPSWGMSTTDGTLYWSPGSTFQVEARNRSGKVIWRLDGPAGPAVTPADLDALEDSARARATLMPFAEEDFNKLRERSDSTFPAIAGMIALPTNGVLAVGPLTHGDSTRRYYRIDADGVPTAQFVLGARTHVLLAAGDSLLVHRPTMGEPWEVRWLELK